MSNAADAITIPDDMTSCHALIEQLVGTVKELHQKNETLDREKQDIQLAYIALLQQAFRRRSERYIEDPSQLKLDFGDSDDASDAAEGLSQAVEETEQTISRHTRRAPRKTRNEKLPEHLPRHEVEADVPDEMKNCPQHGPRKLIGYDTTEKLVFKRPELSVLVTKYPKYICETSPQCGVTSAERPTGLVEGDRYDTSVTAEVITGKYGYHLPIYRQRSAGHRRHAGDAASAKKHSAARRRPQVATDSRCFQKSDRQRQTERFRANVGISRHDGTAERF